MKLNQFVAILAVGSLGFCAESAMAQGNDQVGDAPPPMSETTAPAEGGDAQPYNETVTIDSDANAAGGSSSDAGIAAQPEKAERLRVYSGKHDGNNVISDPR